MLRFAVIKRLGFLCQLLAGGLATTTAAAKPEEGALTPLDVGFDYTFARPVKAGEHTYRWYRQTHAEQAAKLMGLEPKVVADGMDTWHWWTGVDNPGFYRDLAKLTASGLNPTEVRIDFLRMLMTVPRDRRFADLGLINDPDAVATFTADNLGLTLDKMKDGTLSWDPEVFGYSSGVIGLQLFKNPKFDLSTWSANEYLKDAGSVEPPYLVGLTCAFCHIGFNPQKPPVNPAEPDWDNLTSTIGNQYLREGLLFALGVNNRSLAFQYLSLQEPGTSETSRFPSDFINNPTVINSIYRLTARLKEKHVEKITPAQSQLIQSMYKNAGLSLDNPSGALGGSADQPTMAVPHVLTDGSDSLGVLMASVRVYVNEGMMHQQWYKSWPMNPWDIGASLKRGFTPAEFDLIGEARKDPNSPWMQTERRMPNMATFLASYDSFPLGGAHETPGHGGKSGHDYLTTDQALLKRGKLAFADHCAPCHSSKLPSSLPASPAAAQAAWRELVLSEDFLKDNYLSDDQRHPLSELGTNAQRAEGTNAQAGSTWGQMSSQSYKDLRDEQMELIDFDLNGKPILLYNPLTGHHDIKWSGPGSYYRTPSLVSIWATAPYLHNNSVGSFTGDPSIVGRMNAYKDGMAKLLWPERRLGVKSIKVITQDTSLPDLFPAVKTHLKGLDDMELKLLKLPRGTPLNLIMNVHPRSVAKLFEAYVGGVLHGEPRHKFKSLIDRRRDAGMKAFTAELLKVSTCPDLIEDKGHVYGAKMSGADKLALIEYMKYF